jgi:peptidoglycan/LPS O-acetylase OafA/YrhL
MSNTRYEQDIGRERLLGIDLLRLVAALMVVASHYLSSATEKDRHSLKLGSIFDWGDSIATAAHFGFLGVDLFFMISGFVIALSAENRSVRDFLASRAARLLPAFWVCCLITWVAIKLDPGYRDVSLAQLVANLFLVLRPLGYAFVDGVYWSLVIEVRFYLMIALLMWCFGMKAFPTFLAVWLLFALVDTFLTLPSAIRFAVIPQFAACFVVGGALHLIRQRRHTRLSYGLFAVALALACHNATQKASPVFAFQGLVISAVLLFGAFLLWLFANGRPTGFARPWMAVAGSLTFPLYLLHEDLGFLFMRHFPATGIVQIDNRFAVTLLAVVFFLLAAHAVVFVVEKLIAPRVRRWLSGAPARPCLCSSG